MAALLKSDPAIYGALILILVFGAVIGPVNAQFPVPRRYDGFLYGKGGNDAIVIEAFLDIMCPSCRASWPVLKNVSTYYGDDKVDIIIHPFSNPFHHYSFHAARGMHAVAALNSSLPIAWMEAVFERQERFDNNATALETPASTLERFSDIAPKIGLSGTSFLHAFDREDVDLAARVSFKYGCARSVVWTPTHLVNGAPLGATNNWDLDAWKRLLDPLFAKDSKRARASVAIV
ncbi:hypothetical protein KFL_000100260 [Klebsormidium nitens]|uniref:Thioredoxin-like fold domain-containing protein n=1 Tax=Klebsormidium nitens TaxID=105231 RepID=A0A1Y1HIE8_KLENI|nr:hypothetical protein KFL_000100260 [Klebsormidium nitens]|eukprot:GAQ78260.1 hypothetical protein KFL_000100260 [Klebsormidium nitens]